MLNRGVLHLEHADLERAQRGPDPVRRLRRDRRRAPGLESMARHNLGYVDFLAGRIPRAIAAYRARGGAPGRTARTPPCSSTWPVACGRPACSRDADEVLAQARRPALAGGAAVPGPGRDRAGPGRVCAGRASDPTRRPGARGVGAGAGSSAAATSAGSARPSCSCCAASARRPVEPSTRGAAHRSRRPRQPCRRPRRARAAVNDVGTWPGAAEVLAAECRLRAGELDRAVRPRCCVPPTRCRCGSRCARSAPSAAEPRRRPRAGRSARSTGG